MKHIRELASCAVVAAALFFTGCTEELTGNEEQSLESTKVQIAFKKNAPIRSIASRGEIYTVGADFDTIWGDAYVDSSGFIGSLDKIPAGQNRTVGVNIYDSLNDLRYHGEDVVDIRKGYTDTLFMTLYRVTETGSLIVTGEVVDSSDNSLGFNIVTWLGSYSEHPANPLKYYAYFNTVENMSYIYNGYDWVELNSGFCEDLDTAGVIDYKGSFSYSPENPLLNWVYYNTIDKTTYIFDGHNWQIMYVDPYDPIDTIIIVDDTTIIYDTLYITDTLYNDSIIIIDSVFNVDTIYIEDTIYVSTTGALL